jgi:hypothetical protein
MKNELSNVIIVRVAQEFGYTKDQLISNRRDILLFVARQYLYHYLDYYVGLEMDEIAEIVQKDRSSVWQSLATFEKNIGRKKDYTKEFMRISEIVRSITINYMDYFGYDTTKWQFRSRRNVLAGTDISRVDRLLDRYWQSQKRKRKLEASTRSYTRNGDQSICR